MTLLGITGTQGKLRYRQCITITKGHSDTDRQTHIPITKGHSDTDRQTHIPIIIHDSVQSMGYSNNSTISKFLPYGLLNEVIRFHVNGSCCFIQN